jgi:FtsP/CotA-like multicopper oxidase with cupredoxin domain
MRALIPLVAAGALAAADYLPVETPNGATLESTVVDGVKVVHLVAEPVEHEFAPGLKAHCWGYNGRTPGPTIEAVEGDRLRIYLTNHLPEATSLHLHGLLMPNGMDGVSGVTQEPVPPGATWVYEVTLKQHGTLMYHPHYDEMVQIGLGMEGMLVIHPREEAHPVDRDFAIMLAEWKIPPGAERPDPSEMSEFNVLTMNSRAFPGTAPLVARTGQRLRIRFGNLGPMDHHPIHFHGLRFRVTGTDGGDIPESAQQPETTVLVPVGTTRTIEFTADAPGDWVLHCHMLHHTMTQMGHGLPSLIGIDTAGLDERLNRLLPSYMTMGETGMGGMGEMRMPVPPNSLPMVGTPGPHGTIDMGGMFTVLKVRDGITSYEDPGWYQQPPGTSARPATEDELKRDGIDPAAPPKPKP